MKSRHTATPEDWQRREALAEQVADRPDDVGLRLDLAAACLRLEQFADCRQSLLAAIALAPGEPRAYAAMAACLMAEEQGDRAAAYLARAAAVDPDNPRWQNQLAALLADDGRPYGAAEAMRRSLALQPDQPEVAAALAASEALRQPRRVTVGVQVDRDDACLPLLLAALATWTYPAAQLVLLFNGQPARTASLPLPAGTVVLQTSEPEPAAAGWNRILAAASGEYLALLHGDTVPGAAWLERLMLRFERQELLGDRTVDILQFLGAVSSSAVDAHGSQLADQWRQQHITFARPGQLSQEQIPWVYPGAAVFRRQALVEIGGWDERINAGADLFCCQSLRQRGYGLGHWSEAEARRHRHDALAGALDQAIGHQTPYCWEYTFQVYNGGPPREWLAFLDDLVRRQTIDQSIDDSLHLDHLAYPTFLLLPWLMLTDLARSVATVDAQHRRAALETQAAVHLGFLAVLAETTAPRPLLELLAEDLLPVRPDDEELAALCGLEGVAALLESLTGGGFNPLELLTRRDQQVLATALQTAGAYWLERPPEHWQRVWTSARRLRREAVWLATCTGDALAVACVNPLELPDQPRRCEGRSPVDAAAAGPEFPLTLANCADRLRELGCRVAWLDAVGESRSAAQLEANLVGADPRLVILPLDPDRPQPTLDLAARLDEFIDPPPDVLIYGPATLELASRVLAAAPQLDAVLTGDPPAVAVELLLALSDGAPVEQVAGLVWRDDEGQVVANQPRARPTAPPLQSYGFCSSHAYHDAFPVDPPRPLLRLQPGEPSDAGAVDRLVGHLAALAVDWPGATVVVDQVDAPASSPLMRAVAIRLAAEPLGLSLLLGASASQVEPDLLELVWRAGAVSFNLLADGPAESVAPLVAAARELGLPLVVTLALAESDLAMGIARAAAIRALDPDEARFVATGPASAALTGQVAEETRLWLALAAERQWLAANRDSSSAPVVEASLAQPPVGAGRVRLRDAVVLADGERLVAVARQLPAGGLLSFCWCGAERVDRAAQEARVAAWAAAAECQVVAVGQAPQDRPFVLLHH